MLQATEVTQSIVVNVPPERAFEVFTDGFDGWWPRSHSIAEADLAKAVIDRDKGSWYEIGTDGSVTEWGRILSEQPLVLQWRIGGDWALESDPDAFSEIHVSFVPEGDGTRVELAHRHLERHTQAEALAEAVAQEGGWPGLLKRYSDAVG